jgi:DnaJ family protein C protein 22
MAKTLLKAYTCWLLGGILGLHHIYLNRPKQAFIWFTTLGGFLVGFLRDLYRMPAYVREANLDAKYLESITREQDQLMIPIFKTSRFVGSICVGAAFDYVAKYAITKLDAPDADNSYSNLLHCLSPFLVATFVYLVNTERPTRCSFKWPLIGSYLAYAFDTYRVYFFSFSSPIAASLLLNWNIEWDKDCYKNKQTKTSSTRKALKVVYFTSGALFVVLLFSLFLVNNVSYELDGKRVTLRDSFSDFFDSKEMKDMKEMFKMMWNFYQAHGFRKAMNHFVYGYDAEAIADAYKSIEMTEKSTQRDLDLKCKTLSRKWHPDKYKVGNCFTYRPVRLVLI